VGNLLLVFHFSTRGVVGVLGMWESRSDFQGLWKAGYAFHQSVISTGKVLFGGRLGFCFLGLLDSIARDVQLENHAVVHQAVNGRRRRHGVLEDAFPL
jgi:hypothetical protein